MTVTNMSDERGRGMAGTGQPPAIALRGVRKNFGSVQAVRGIDLDISSGEIVAFLGPNGAGKTSTIDIILGLSQPTAGSVVGVSACSPRQAISRGLVSAVMQTGGLLKDLTVAETVRVHREPVRRHQAGGRGAAAGRASPPSPTAWWASAPAVSSSGCASPWPCCPTRNC